MSYVVECIRCGENFRKFSNRGTNIICQDCQPNKTNRYTTRSKAADSFSERLLNIEAAIDGIGNTQDLWQSAAVEELRPIIEQICHVTMNDMLQALDLSRDERFKAIQSELVTKLAVVNTRMVNHESTIKKQVQQINSLRRKIAGQLGSITRASSSLSNDRRLNPETTALHILKALGHINGGGPSFSISRKELLATVWQDLTPAQATNVLTQMTHQSLLIRRGRGKAVRYWTLTTWQPERGEEE